MRNTVFAICWVFAIADRDDTIDPLVNEYGGQLASLYKIPRSGFNILPFWVLAVDSDFLYSTNQIKSRVKEVYA